MRFLVDECTGPKVAGWLLGQAHDVFSVFDETRVLTTTGLFKRPFEEDWILITNDKDFGEKVHREGHPHHGVVFLRLSDERAANKIDVLRRLLQEYMLSNRFVVVTETRVRFART